MRHWLARGWACGRRISNLWRASRRATPPRPRRSNWLWLATGWGRICSPRRRRFWRVCATTGCGPPWVWSRTWWPGSAGGLRSPPALVRRTAAMIKTLQRVLRGKTRRRQGGLWVVYPGQLLGRSAPHNRGTIGQDVFGRPLPAALSTLDGNLLLPGSFISHDEMGQLQAERFGYLCQRGGGCSWCFRPSNFRPIACACTGWYEGPIRSRRGRNCSCPGWRIWGWCRGRRRPSCGGCCPRVAQAHVPGRYLLAQG